MSAATAWYNLGEFEALQCHKCGEVQRGDQDEQVEITTFPDGFTVNILCTSCAEKEAGEL